jgi:exosortase D (VPLPA-CTERM-specific)
MELPKQKRLSTHHTISVIFLASTFIFFYLTTLSGLLNLWLNDGNYSYALSIPLISGYVIWKRRHQIANTPVSTCWLGGVFFLLFLIISLYGILGSSPSAVRPAIPLIILSLTLFCFGREMLKILAFPLSLLIFMIPLPTLIQTRLGVPLQLLSTKLGELILRLCGVTVFVEGNIIDLGVTQLQVVDACSGLRYILPLFALGVVFVNFFEKTRWKQIVLVISTIPIAIVVNALRIGITGFLAQNFGTKIADGFFHGFSGWLIFILALLMVFLFFYILRVLFPKGPFANTTDSIHENRLLPSNSGKNTFAALAVAGVLLLLSGIWSFTTAAYPPVQIKGGLSYFPLTIDGWHGRPENIDTRIISLSGAEDAFNGTYRSSPAEIVSLYIGYRASPFNESENFFHSPNICLPSLGWKTIAISNHEIRGVPKFDKIIVRKMLIEKMGYRQMVYYWFQTKNRVSSNVNINRLHLTLHAFVRENTHDLFIRPISPLKPDETVEKAQERMDQFVREMMGSLLDFLAERQFVSY